MNEQDEINPYAAPKSETLVDRLAEERMKRPASVKWALAIMSIAAPVLLYRYVEQSAEFGWRLLTDKTWGTITDAFRVAAFFALLFGGRNPWVFWTTDIALASNLIQSGV